MQIERTTLVNCLESVSPGLSTRDIIEQADCFIFKKGRIITFNDDVACSCDMDTGIEGAVKASPLLNLLQKLKDKTLELKVTNKQIILQGKGRKAGIRMEKKIQLPIDSIEPAGDWHQLPKDFCEGVGMVEDCASSDESRFNLTCIHLTNTHVEATDGYQASRFKIKIPIKESMLVRHQALNYASKITATKISISKSWVHFQNANGLILSCRRYVEEYPLIDKVLLEVKGTSTTLPQGLAIAAERASVFSAQNPDNQVIITIEKNRVKVKGESTGGWFWESKKAKYDGPCLNFTIPPTLLIKILKRNCKCILTENRLKMTDDKYSYIVCLGTIAKE